jgi:prepilin-type N-terminal cleavage/methylation domain-containing protein
MSRWLRSARRHPAFTLVELLVVIIILCILLAFLLPTLSTARKRAAMSSLQVDKEASVAQNVDVASVENRGATLPARPAAHVKSFDADIALTPGLSVGTAEPESIYEVKFAAKMDVKPSLENPAAGLSGGTAPPAATTYEVLLPLPPQIISLADLTVTMNGEPSDDVAIRGDRLVWHGRVDPLGPAALNVTYSAVGKGLYVLQTPPGKILDRFRIGLQARGSDVRMLELSLQPTSLSRTSGATTYNWDYKRLMFGRPIALDVLGVAPLDRLGELRWLGPMSVIVLGLIVGLVANAWQVERFDRWLLLLVLGTFAGSYPLMYFAQEFIPLTWAMLISGGAALLVVAVRTMTVMGFRLGLFGVVIPAAMVMSVALIAAVKPQLQGVLLTGLALWVFTVAMMLAPRLHLPKRERSSEPPPPLNPEELVPAS